VPWFHPSTESTQNLFPSTPFEAAGRSVSDTFLFVLSSQKEKSSFSSSDEEN